MTHGIMEFAKISEQEWRWFRTHCY